MNDQNQKFDDDITVVGGVDMPDEMFISVDGTMVPSDDLGQQLYWLQKLNPGVIQFSVTDLTAMDDVTKQTMINSIQFALGNKALSDCIS